MRTGSSLLCSRLNTHPDIECHLEILHRKHYKGSVRGVPKYLREKAAAGEKKHYGFKIMYHQLWGYKTAGFNRIAAAIRRNKIIHLTRPNHLDAYLSLLLARQSKVWNAFETQQIDRHFIQNQPDTDEKYNQPVVVDVAAYDKFSARYKRWIRLIKDTYPDAYHATYDEVSESLGPIQEFLRVRRADLKGDTVKLRTKTKRELIVNYDEVCEHFAKIERSWMLDDKV